VEAAAAKAIPRTTNGAMLAAIVPIVPYGLSKTTHDAISKRMAAETTAVGKYLFKATLPQFGRDAEPSIEKRIGSTDYNNGVDRALAFAFPPRSESNRQN